jgi:hypothetical protein
VLRKYDKNKTHSESMAKMRPMRYANTNYNFNERALHNWNSKRQDAPGLPMPLFDPVSGFRRAGSDDQRG